ncbi:MAG: hypothetical protein GX895_04760 [Clostridiales bacterium]|nr:hypothetical protein [Clostridiales bacterium]
MEERINKLKKGVKTDGIITLIIVLIMLASSVASLVDIIKLSNKNSQAFEVKILNDGKDKGNYCLFIDGENQGPVDYNEYLAYVDSNGNINVKICHIAAGIAVLIRRLFMAVIFYFAYLILKNIFKPFCKNNIRTLRIMSLLTLLLSCVPALVEDVIKAVTFGNTTIVFSQMDFFAFMMAVLLGIISEVFKYGNYLQEEIEQIA